MRRLGLLTAAGALLAGGGRADDEVEARAKRPTNSAAATAPATATPPITASLATLKPGARCRVELKPSPGDGREAPRAYEGVITQSNEKGVGLALSKGKQVLVRRTLVGQAPILDRLYHRAGVERPALEAMTEVWLPTRTIASIHLIDAAKSKKRRLAPAARALHSR